MADSIVVYCKFTNGVVLDLVDMVERHEPVPGGGSRTFMLAKRTKRIVLKGPRPFSGQDERRATPTTDGSPEGYVRNEIPRDFWETWVSQNHDSPLLENKILLAYPKDDKGLLREHEAVLTGRERLQPDARTRIDGKDVPADIRVRSVNSGLGALKAFETANSGE